MTVKELAEFTGKTERAIQNWIKKASMKNEPINEKSSLSSPRNPADYSVDEVELILNESKLGKNAVLIVMENARRSKDIAPVENGVDYEVIGRMIGMAITAAMSPILERMDSMAPARSEQLRIAATPEMPVKQQIKRVVNDHAYRTGMNHRDVYNELYREFNYYHRMNVGLAARNRNTKVIDYIDSLDMLPELLAVAKKIFREGQLI